MRRSVGALTLSALVAVFTEPGSPCCSTLAVHPARATHAPTTAPPNH